VLVFSRPLEDTQVDVTLTPDPGGVQRNWDGHGRVLVVGHDPFPAPTKAVVIGITVTDASHRTTLLTATHRLDFNLPPQGTADSPRIWWRRIA
jgi:hypothetical protein